MFYLKWELFYIINLKTILTKILKTEPIQKKLNVEFKTRIIEKMRRQGKAFAIVQLKNPRIVSDQRGNKYKVSGGAKLQGTLTADFNFSYQEDNGLVTNFDSIEIINSLDVQGLKIPLESTDKVLSVLSETEYLTRRLFGDFF